TGLRAVGLGVTQCLLYLELLKQRYKQPHPQQEGVQVYRWRKQMNTKCKTEYNAVAKRV
ncbi:hypothetical protein L915_02336, partial [Phytophthora nicotianae]